MAGAGRTALVTGANRGIGLEVCAQLKAQGFAVILTSRDEADGRAAAEKLGVDYRRLDVANPKSIAALADGLRRDGRSIDVLINNAAVSLDGFDSAVVRQTLAANFFGALALTEALLPLMTDGGAIVMVSSGMGELHAYSPACRGFFLYIIKNVTVIRSSNPFNNLSTPYFDSPCILG